MGITLRLEILKMADRFSFNPKVVYEFTQKICRYITTLHWFKWTIANLYFRETVRLSLRQNAKNTVYHSRQTKSIQLVPF